MSRRSRWVAVLAVSRRDRVGGAGGRAHGARLQLAGGRRGGRIPGVGVADVQRGPARHRRADRGARRARAATTRAETCTSPTRAPSRWTSSRSAPAPTPRSGGSSRATGIRSRGRCPSRSWPRLPRPRRRRPRRSTPQEAWRRRRARPRPPCRRTARRSTSRARLGLSRGLYVMIAVMIGGSASPRRRDLLLDSEGFAHRFAEARPALGGGLRSRGASSARQGGRMPDPRPSPVAR